MTLVQDPTNSIRLSSSNRTLELTAETHEQILSWVKALHDLKVPIQVEELNETSPRKGFKQLLTKLPKQRRSVEPFPGIRCRDEEPARERWKNSRPNSLQQESAEVRMANPSKRMSCPEGKEVIPFPGVRFTAIDETEEQESDSEKFGERHSTFSHRKIGGLLKKLKSDKD